MTEITNITAELAEAYVTMIGKGVIVVGEVFNDSKGRFFDGDIVRTSIVKKIDYENNLVYTMNSVYKVLNWSGVK